MYDVAIIGTGPAGISAALCLKLHSKSIIWFGSKSLSTKVEKSEKIANYPGVPMATGQELNNHFKQQIDEMGIEITDRMVTNISSNRNGFMLLGGNDVYEAKTVLLATGSAGARGFKGEQELLGRGVSYCATCDGFFYKGKTIAVYCADKKFEHEAEYLGNIADKLYFFAPYKNCEINMPNIIKTEKTIEEISGSDRVNEIILTDNTRVDVDGVFILRNAVAPALLVKGLQTDGAHVSVNRKMQTSKAGCFAAGDCTGRPYQITKAVGEGNIAAHSILDYLSEMGESR